METVTDFIFLGFNITEDGDCGVEMKRGLLLGRKVMANLDSILKSTDRPLPTKVHKSDARLSRVPWTSMRSNQSILKEISPEYSLQGQMLKLKLQYFDHLLQITDSLEKILMLGKIEDRRRWGEMVGWHHRLNAHEFE